LKYICKKLVANYTIKNKTPPMIEEQTTPDDTSEGTEGTQNVDVNNTAQGSDDYYSVDNPKKDLHTNIGDGEMHNEGLVGDGNVADDITFSDGSTNEQDEAENHDSDG
jgi:hypothetical protein